MFVDQNTPGHEQLGNLMVILMITLVCSFGPDLTHLARNIQH
jgi:hypothetical protein